MTRLTLLLAILLISHTGRSQAIGFSLGNDMALQRSWKEGQQFWAFGHTINAQFHLTGRDAVYTWFSYYSPGRFTNQLAATAKSSLTQPQQLNYNARARMRFKHVSVGWKHYFTGRFDAEKGWNSYGLAGFGLLAGNITNTLSAPVDTALYSLPVRGGAGAFKRLTFDLGLGIEKCVGGDLYVYTELIHWIPASDYPSPFVLANRRAPQASTFHAGIRILF